MPGWIWPLLLVAGWLGVLVGVGLMCLVIVYREHRERDVFYDDEYDDEYYEDDEPPRLSLVQ